MELTNLYMDTHKIVRLLQGKGYSEEKAEGFIQAIQEITLTGIASKEDLQKVRTELKKEIQNVRTELKKEIQNVRTKLKKEIQDVRNEIQEVRKELKDEIQELRKELYDFKSDMYKFMITNSFVVVGLTVTLIKFLG